MFKQVIEEPVPHALLVLTMTDLPFLGQGGPECMHKRDRLGGGGGGYIPITCYADRARNGLFVC